MPSVFSDPRAIGFLAGQNRTRKSMMAPAIGSPGSFVQFSSPAENPQQQQENNGWIGGDTGMMNSPPPPPSGGDQPGPNSDPYAANNVNGVMGQDFQTDEAAGQMSGGTGQGTSFDPTSPFFEGQTTEHDKKDRNSDYWYEKFGLDTFTRDRHERIIDEDYQGGPDQSNYNPGVESGVDPNADYRQDEYGNVYDKDGNFLYNINQDAEGKSTKDEQGNTQVGDTEDTEHYKVDADGNVYDKDGNFMYHIGQNADGTSDGSIGDAPGREGQTDYAGGGENHGQDQAPPMDPYLIDYLNEMANKEDFSSVEQGINAERDKAISDLAEMMASRGMGNSGVEGAQALDVYRGAAQDIASSRLEFNQQRKDNMTKAAEMLFGDRWKQMDEAQQQRMAEYMLEHEKEMFDYVRQAQAGDPGPLKSFVHDVENTIYGPDNRSQEQKDKDTYDYLKTMGFDDAAKKFKGSA